MRFSREEDTKLPQKEVPDSLRQGYKITTYIRYGVPSYELKQRSSKTDCVTIYLWSYVRATIEYKLIPYYLTNRKCTDISERDLIVLSIDGRTHTYIKGV